MVERDQLVQAASAVAFHKEAEKICLGTVSSSPPCPFSYCSGSSDGVAGKQQVRQEDLRLCQAWWYLAGVQQQQMFLICLSPTLLVVFLQCPGYVKCIKCAMTVGHHLTTGLPRAAQAGALFPRGACAAPERFGTVSPGKRMSV